LPEALESLLSQTHWDFRVMVCDDGLDRACKEVLDLYADERFVYLINPRRLGMIGNWRRVFHEGRARWPQARYFAWVSDHDAWHPRWLECLVSELDVHPEAVAAYPRNIRISGDGDPLYTPWSFETAGQTDVVQRVRAASRGMYAGDMVYGLLRADAVAMSGVFRPMLLPDRLLLTELAVHGEFRQVHEILWYRRFAGLASLPRQRASFFPDGVPAYAYLPWWLLHPAVLAWSLGRNGHVAGVSRGKALAVAGAHLRMSVLTELNRKLARGVRRVYRRYPPLRHWRKPRRLAYAVAEHHAETVRRLLHR
jgi:glycosyltransferase involved in cell wall biosynthesis